MKGSLAISDVVAPSKPSASARRAAGATARQSARGRVVSTRIAGLRQRVGPVYGRPRRRRTAARGTRGLGAGAESSPRARRSGRTRGARASARWCWRGWRRPSPRRWRGDGPPRSRRPELACKPGSVPAPDRSDTGEDHSSRRRIAAPLERSHPDAGPRLSARDSGGPPSATSLFELAPGGVCPAAGHPVDAWALTPRFHPCLCLHRGPSPGPRLRRPSAVWFLWHFPSGHPGSPLATSLPCGARTFLPRAVRARRRSSVQLRSTDQVRHAAAEGHPPHGPPVLGGRAGFPVAPAWPMPRQRASIRRLASGAAGSRRPRSAQRAEGERSSSGRRRDLATGSDRRPSRAVDPMPPRISD